MHISVVRKNNLKCRALTNKGIPCKHKARLAELCTVHYIEFYTKRGLKLKFKR